MYNKKFLYLNEISLCEISLCEISLCEISLCEIRNFEMDVGQVMEDLIPNPESRNAYRISSINYLKLSQNYILIHKNRIKGV
jgi:hypothetical protein